METKSDSETPRAPLIINRRQAVSAAGIAAAGLLVGAGRTPVSSLFGSDAEAATACASLTPAKEIGPYFVEEKLNRSDITTDPSTGAVSPGVPLTLNWTLLDEDNGCAPLVGAQVDIWHADASGKYSDEAVEGTTGHKQLRGYQVSDSNGKVTFKTVYPGWYSGRAVHIHVRVRLFNAAGAATYDFLTQVFFDESITNTVYAVGPYNTRGTRDTLDSNDHVYGSDGASVQLGLTGDPSSGYVGVFTFGLSKTGAASSGGSTTTNNMTTTTTTKTDSKVSASLKTTKFTRTSLGTRRLYVTVDLKETVSLDVRLLRGSVRLKRKKFNSLAKGTHVLKVVLNNSVEAGKVHLDIIATDKRANTKVLSKVVTVPARR